ncbi:MAG: type IV secretion system protein [Turicibacter sp.]|nr:type IV secretion system protein [Turicibacter sp.]
MNIGDMLGGAFDWIIEHVTQPIKDTVAGWAVNSLNYAFDMIGVDSTIGDMLAAHPEELTGFEFMNTNIEVAVVGQSVFSYLLDIGQSILLPFGLVILVVLSMHELATGVLQGNMREFEFNIFMRWGAKFIISLFILSNAFNIVRMLFSLGPALFEMFNMNVADSANTDFSTLYDGLRVMDFGDILQIWAISIITLVLAFIAQMFILYTLISRMFEVALLTSLAPIPLATFSNSEYKRVGEGFLKTIMVYGLQALLIIVIATVFSGILLNTVTNIANSGEVVFWDFVPLLIMKVVMVGMIKQSKSIVEKVVN